MSDGETMERLWSYLRRFSRMTKEMDPSHCIDVLTSALVYYGIQTNKKLGIYIHWPATEINVKCFIMNCCIYQTAVASLLPLWLERAIKTVVVAEESLNELMPKSLEGLG